MKSGQPYLSLVVTARNDDHGGNLLGRMQIFASGWIAQARRHNLPSELIIVEWNPPRDRGRLQEVLQWPEDFGPCEVRFIEVPPELHRRYEHAEALPLYQMIAKNVGVRRARGQFILATNIDILFSDELVAFLAERRLQPGRMYRIDRHDAMGEVPVEASIEEQLVFCRTHLLRINAREGTFSLNPDGKRALSNLDITTPESGITFGRGWFPPERYPNGEVFRWADNDLEIDLRLPVESCVLCLEVEPGPGMDGRSMQLRILNGARPIRTAEIVRRSELKVYIPDSGERKLCLQILGGGEAVAQDPRILNLRAFSCGLEKPRAGFERCSVKVVPVGLWKRTVVLWHQFQELLNRLATGDRFVKLTIPVSRRVSRALAFYLWSEGAGGRVLQRLHLRPRTGPRKMPEARPAPPFQMEFLHTNGCGDFTMAAREHWFDLRGYPEFDQFSMNIDSVFCYALHHGGVREEILPDPMRIYHIEHGTGSGWTPEGQATLFERIAAKGLTFVSWEDVLGWATQMRRLNCPMIFNHENWGLAEFQLEERQPRRSAHHTVQPEIR